ncbi:uncharacterized protein (TIGR02646 family) [Sphingobium xenophagum]|uniref:Uncharacterized protein (TIGR02646 family) n=1 Tax=Sphingobium xenophagum TaxID=121428 RepID=A0ABU1X279_SPHXE|nr:hypothetical protein [Sphingobium xenophagum]MDR7155690.1 uncharacterized protein (TIGR02646 family) [Sphingobium xenophagum]
MIKVDRPAPPPSLDMTDEMSAASLELKVILDHLAEHGTLPEEKKFNVYSSPPVKARLKEIFRGKCAYCEIYATASFDGDVEHYRPKGGVTDADDVAFAHPGYWWLAMAWDNLVLSCQHCNQSRKQLIHQPGLDEAAIAQELLENRLRTTGKKNRFPVRNNKWVVAHDTDLADEDPLLIDPTVDQPEDLLEWEFERSISTVKARNGNPKAAETIDILGLNRRGLTEARVSVLNAFRQKRRTILNRLNRIADTANTSDEVAQALRDIVLEDLEDFNANCTPDSQFAGMARAFRLKLVAEVQGML